MDNILRAQGITVTYRVAGYKKTKIINNVSFCVKTGGYFCIIGGNGSGKSTLMKALLGLTPLANGDVCFGISKNEISYLPQTNTISCDFPATVYEVVLSGTQLVNASLPFYKKSDHESAVNSLKLVDLLQMRGHKFKELSVGQQRRVLLARTLSRQPKLLFLDEPCASLDENITSQFYDILQKLNKEKRISIIMISHDSGQVEKYATHVLHLNKTVLFCGPISEWIASSKNVKCMH